MSDAALWDYVLIHLEKGNRSFYGDSIRESTIKVTENSPC